MTPQDLPGRFEAVLYPPLNELEIWGRVSTEGGKAWLTLHAKSRNGRTYGTNYRLPSVKEQWPEMAKSACLEFADHLESALQCVFMNPEVE